MNWPVIIISGVCAIALIVFLLQRNLKDKRDLENKINRNYRKPRDNEGDIDVEEAMK
ncbi:MAG: hypothetical protein HC867_04740 [Bacteroidia bacterium]|nr:hypothetical protein [Bacteroidia bacterium]